MKRQYVRWKTAAPLIRHADTLLYRRGGCLGSLVAKGGRGEWSHAGKALVWSLQVLVVDTYAIRGCTARLLGDEVRRYPGRIDVFEIVDRQPDGRRYNRWAAGDWMIQLLGTRYGYWALLTAALLHLPIIRLFVRPSTEDNSHAPKRPPYCSMAVAMADRIGGGVDPVPRLADRLTEPSDLARSAAYRYRFTLVP